MAKAVANKGKWTMKSYMASGLDRQEDNFGAHLLGIPVSEFKKYPESEELDRIWVKLLNKVAAKKGKN